VQQGAVALANMLDKIHPVPACRKQLAELGPNAALMYKAKATWSCLGLSASDFDGPITQESDHFADTANTDPNFDEKLGACKGSNWPRGCSYWTSMHTMALKADAENLSHEFMSAVLRIISGGALYCFGCTSHWRFLNTNLLPPGLKDESNMVQY
jgi:hypothetical protein